MFVGLDDALRDADCVKCLYVAGAIHGQTGKAAGPDSARTYLRTCGDAERAKQGCPFCRAFNGGRVKALAILEELVAADEAMRGPHHAASPEDRAAVEAKMKRYDDAFAAARAYLDR